MGVHVGAPIGQVAGEDRSRGEFLGYFPRACGVVNARVSVDPDLIEQPLQAPGASQFLPFTGGNCRLVQDVAQAQDDARARVVGS